MGTEEALDQDQVNMLRLALDDLWGCIGNEEIRDLQPETVIAAASNHLTLWHEDHDE